MPPDYTRGGVCGALARMAIRKERMTGDETTHDSGRVQDRFLGSRRDTLDGPDERIGLARVLVQMDTAALAEDIADLALETAREATSPQDGVYSYVIRVVRDRSVLAAIDVHRLFEAQLSGLVSRIHAYPASPGEPHKMKVPPEAQKSGALPPLATIHTHGQATSFEGGSRIGAHEVSVDDLGFDLEVAHHLTTKTKSDETLVVEVDGLTPIRGSSKILDRISRLTSLSEERLVPALAAEARGLAEAEARANLVKESIKTLDAEILELAKQVREPNRSALVRQRTEQRTNLEDTLPELEAAVSAARSRYELGRALREEIEECVATALAPQGPGAWPPALEAAGVEELAGPGGRARATYVLYVRLIAGGIDEALESRSGLDQFRALAGASAEFALLGSRGRLLTSGVRSVLQTSTMRLDNPRSFHQDRPHYVGLDRGGNE